MDISQEQISSVIEGTFLWWQLSVSPIFWGCTKYRGNGAPVMVIPGFSGSDLFYQLTILPWLARIGYRPFPSCVSAGGLPLNVGCPRDQTERIERRLDGIVKETKRLVVVIGHSLGGMQARVLASKRPDLVKHAIILGSPARVPAHGDIKEEIRDTLEKLQNFWRKLLSLPADCGTSECACGFFERSLGNDLGTTVTSLYSKGDELLDWRVCLGSDPRRNFEVQGGHGSMIMSLSAYQVLAEVLFSLR